MIEYRKGYKYQLARTSVDLLSFCPPRDIHTEYISFTREGRLTIREGYAWDGPSGPTWDTRNFMHGSLIHDALYQLMRGSLLHIDFKDLADRELRRRCLEDGMCRLRAAWVYQGVRLFGYDSAKPQIEPVLTAP